MNCFKILDVWSGCSQDVAVVQSQHGAFMATTQMHVHKNTRGTHKQGGQQYIVLVMNTDR